MKRQVTMEEISDGKLYTSNDLVKADCGDCEGCHACCTGMGSSIVLDPLDIVRICRGTGAAFETLLAGKIELNVVDGSQYLRMSQKLKNGRFLIWLFIQRRKQKK